MSANLYWIPANIDHRVCFGGGSTLAATLERAFGSYPITLYEKDVPKLEGIAACNYDELHNLIDVINTHKAITLTVEY